MHFVASSIAIAMEPRVKMILFLIFQFLSLIVVRVLIAKWRSQQQKNNSSDKTSSSLSSIIQLPLINQKGWIQRVSVSTVQGKRPYQEDRFLVETETRRRFVALADGHGGSDVSDFIKRFITAIWDTDEEKPLHTTRKNSIKESPNEEKEVTDKLQRMYVKLDEAWSKYSKQFKGGVLVGSTLLTCVQLEPHCIWIANAGDCRAVMYQNGKVTQITVDHKPNAYEENKRIIKAGGFVRHYGVARLQGILAVSRSIGDISLKPYVIAEPDVYKIDLPGTTNPASATFIILATDGLWDVLSNEEAVNVVKTCYPDKNNEAAEALTKLATEKHSADNITVVILYL